MQSTNMLTPAVLRCNTLYPNEWEEANLGVSSLWQEGAIWAPHYWRVRTSLLHVVGSILWFYYDGMFSAWNIWNSLDIFNVSLNCVLMRSHWQCDTKKLNLCQHVISHILGSLLYCRILTPCPWWFSEEVDKKNCCCENIRDIISCSLCVFCHLITLQTHAPIV